MKEKLKKHKYITKAGLIIIGMIIVFAYVQLLTIFFTKLYFPIVEEPTIIMMKNVSNEVVSIIANIMIFYAPLIVFYVIAPVCIFGLVYKSFRIDIFGY